MLAEPNPAAQSVDLLPERFVPLEKRCVVRVVRLVHSGSAAQLDPAARTREDGQVAASEAIVASRPSASRKHRMIAGRR